MPWTLFTVPSTRRTELDEVLKDDQVARQSLKVRDAASLAGPSGQLYVLVEGSGEAVGRAESLLGPLGTRLPPAEGEALYRKLKDEEEAASSGMGLFFTE